MRIKVKPLFAWYDLWVGAYWDRRARKLYLLPLPTVGIVIEFERDWHDPKLVKAVADVCLKQVCD